MTKPPTLNHSVPPPPADVLPPELIPLVEMIARVTYESMKRERAGEQPIVTPLNVLPQNGVDHE